MHSGVRECRMEHPLTERTVTNRTPPPETEVAVPEGVQKARAAFLRDYPALHADPRTRGRFVVYHQDQRVGVAWTYRAAIDEVNRLNLPNGEYLVMEVTAESEAWERVGAVEGEIDPD
jgi:hypothetical protein